MAVHRAWLLCLLGVAGADLQCRHHVEELRGIYGALSSRCTDRLPIRWQSREAERKWRHATRMCAFEHGWRHTRALQAELERELVDKCREEVLG